MSAFANCRKSCESHCLPVNTAEFEKRVKHKPDQNNVLRNFSRPTSGDGAVATEEELLMRLEMEGEYTVVMGRLR